MKPIAIRVALIFSILLSFSGCGDERIIAVGGGALPDSFAYADGAALPDGYVLSETQEDQREIVLLHNLDFPEQVVVTQDLPIRAKVLDYLIDGPAANTLVQYTIVENEDDGDASLSSHQAYTDGDGEVVVTFRSNLKSEASYTVELFTEGAQPVYIEIYVSDVPRGDIRVDIDYEGPIAIKNVHVRLLTGSFSCGQFKPTNVPQAVLGDTTLLGLGGEDSVLFPNMPSDQKFTVIATALSPSGSLAAAGCIDGILVMPGAENKVTMTMYMLVLNPSGYYDTTNVFDFTDAIPGELGELINSVVTLFNDPGKFLIDQIKAIVSSFIGELVTDIAFGLFEDALADIVTDWMLNDSPDWIQDIFVVGQDLTQIVNNLEMNATLVISKLSNDYYVQGVLLWDGIVLYWKLGCPKEGEPDFDPACGKNEFNLDDFQNTEFPMDIVEGKFTGSIHDFDQLDVDNHTIKISYGKLIIFVLNEMILKTLTGQDNLTDALLALINCKSIASSFSNGILDGIGISEGDIEDFCTDSIVFLATPVTLLLGSLAIDSQLRLAGKAILVDEDNDLKVDKIIEGEYIGHVESDGQQGPEFSGTWEAWKQPE
jgi:hypothetical protein